MHLTEAYTVLAFEGGTAMLYKKYRKVVSHFFLILFPVSASAAAVPWRATREKSTRFQWTLLSDIYWSWVHCIVLCCKQKVQIFSIARNSCFCCCFVFLFFLKIFCLILSYFKRDVFVSYVTVLRGCMNQM